MENYLEELSLDGKKIFMKVLAHIARADGNFDDDEKEFVKSLCSINDIDEKYFDEIIKKRSDDDIAFLVTEANFSEGLKLALVRDMFTLANADGDLTDNEVLSIANVGEALEIPLEKLEEISEWVADGIDWRLRGQEIFGDFF
ncbi:MAG: TerB family tellurite resistance protein [Alphaproteobacteria bacterium]